MIYFIKVFINGLFKIIISPIVLVLCLFIAIFDFFIIIGDSSSHSYHSFTFRFLEYYKKFYLIKQKNNMKTFKRKGWL